MLAEAVAGAELDGLFDAVLSVDALRVFKTEPRVYQYALDRLGLAESEVAFLSSNGWTPMRRPISACPSSGAIATASRASASGAPDFKILSLAELPPLLGIA